MRNSRSNLPSRNCTPHPKFHGALKIVQPEKLSKKFASYVASNLLSVITTAGSFLGGLLILIYFGSIQYFPPELSLSSVSLLLAASAITGLLLTLLFALYFVFPGFCYRHLLHELWGTLQFVMLNDRAILWLLDVPMIVAIWFVTVTIIFQSNTTVQLMSWSVSLMPLIFVSILTGFVYSIKTIEANNVNKNTFMQSKSEKGWAVKTIVVAGVTIAISGVVASFPLLFTMILTTKYEQTAHDDVWAVFIVMCIIATVANHLVAGAKKWWILFVVAPFVLFAMLGITQQFSLIPQAVVRTLTLGNISNVTLLLDEQGCQIASQYALLAQVDDVKTVSANTSTKVSNIDLKKEVKEKPVVCSLSSVNLLWRIGNEYFIDANQAQLRLPLVDKGENTSGKMAKNKKSQQQIKKVSVGIGSKVNLSVSKATYQLQTLKSRFTIPSVHVLSWTVAEQKKSVGQ